jgi:GT2 family glycosyltransferase
MLSIVTPWKDHPEFIPLYESANTGAECIIIDNGSTVPTAAALVEMTGRMGHGSRVIRNEQNHSFSASNNQGYEVTTGNVILFLNNDIQGAPGWWEAVLRDAVPGVLVGASLQHQLVWGMGLPYLEGWAVAARRQEWERLTETLHGIPAVFTAFGEQVKSHSHETRGPWDTAYPLYWEDNDLSLRALQAGLKLVVPHISTPWHVSHLGGRTAGNLLNHGASFEAGRARYAERVAAIWHKRTAAARLEGVTW